MGASNEALSNSRLRMIRVSSFGRKSLAWRDDLVRKTQRFYPLRWNEISLKSQTSSRPAGLLPEEEKFLKKQTAPFVLLDQNGRVWNDEQFFDFCLQGPDRHFVIGPSFGFHPAFFEKAQFSLSLSSLTLTHELAQTVFAECLYRAGCRHINHPFVK